MKAFLTVFNVPEWPAQMIPDLKRLGLFPVLIVNGCEWEPCRQWLKELETDDSVQVLYLEKNFGCTAIRDLGIAAAQTERFIITDGDLDLSEVPDDAVEKMNTALNRNPDVGKAGLSLRIDDLPDTEMKPHVLGYEQRHWIERREPDCFLSQIDTTLAMYCPKRMELIREDWHRAVRLNEPYTARHIPWYYSTDELPESYAFACDISSPYHVYSHSFKVRRKDNFKKNSELE